MEQIPAFYFDRTSLSEIADLYKTEFKTAKPFPHVAVDNFLPEEIAFQLAKEFPGPNEIPWHLEGPGDAKHSNDKNIEKITTSNEEYFPHFIRHLMQQFNSSVFLGYLESLTGFRSLAPDPAFHGCGLHSTGRGGRLMIHADQSRHRNPNFHQILNMIYYVTPGWKDTYGGHLELWDSDAAHCEKCIAPMFNRCVVFYTGAKCYHGHPYPLDCPVGMRRDSLAVYYYSTDRQFNADYEGWKDYVEWVPATEYDQDRSLFHVIKALTRRRLPTHIVNNAAKYYRKLRRQSNPRV